jgi:hypothetical protein
MRILVITLIACGGSAAALLGEAAPAANRAIVVPDVAGLRAQVSYHRIQVSWQQPTYAGYDHVAIWEVINDGVPVKVYTGTDTSFTTTDVDHTQHYQFHVVTIDQGGQYSEGDNVDIATSALLLAPAEGASIQKPPRLTWALVPGASFYNVQLYQNGVKLLSSWPRARHLQLGRSWSFAGKHHSLRPGRVHWYIWPAFGSRGDPQYGTQMGASSFIVPGSACTSSLAASNC